MVKLRVANKNDCELLFKWANDRTVRQNSFNTQDISFDTHIKWFNSKIDDQNTIIFIITIEDKDVGQIRIDIQDNIGTINYSIDNKYRGRGIGTKALVIIKEIMKDIKIVGYVKKDNIASIKAFEKAGYEKKEYEEYIEFISNIR